VTSRPVFYGRDTIGAECWDFFYARHLVPYSRTLDWIPNPTLSRHSRALRRWIQPYRAIFMETHNSSSPDILGIIPTKLFISLVALPISSSSTPPNPPIPWISTTSASIRDLTHPLVNISYHCFHCCLLLAELVLCINIFCGAYFPTLPSPLAYTVPSVPFDPPNCLQASTKQHSFSACNHFKHTTTMGCSNMFEALKDRFRRLRPAWTRKQAPTPTRELQIVSLADDRR